MITDEQVSQYAWAFLDGEHARVVRWLKRHGCKLIAAERRADPQNAVYTFEGPEPHGIAFDEPNPPRGIVCGLHGGGEPITTTMQICILLGGQRFTKRFPAALKLTVKEWDRRRRKLEGGV